MNRRRLPAPQLAKRDYVAPETDTERQIAEIYAGLLGTDGCRSQIVLRPRRQLARRRKLAAGRVAHSASTYPSRMSSEAPSVRGAHRSSSSGSNEALAPIVAADSRPPNTFTLFRAAADVFINRFDRSTRPTTFPPSCVTGDLDLDALREAVVDVVARHEVLRTTFPTHDGVPYQRIGRASTIGAKLDWDIVDDLAELGRQSPKAST